MVTFLSTAAVKVADGGKVLTYEYRQRDVFADAWDHQFARGLVLAAQDHFVAPDNAAAFGAHDVVPPARLRHAACDFVIPLFEEARAQFEALGACWLIGCRMTTQGNRIWAVMG